MATISFEVLPPQKKEEEEERNEYPTKQADPNYPHVILQPADTLEAIMRAGPERSAEAPT